MSFLKVDNLIKLSVAALTCIGGQAVQAEETNTVAAKNETAAAKNETAVAKKETAVARNSENKISAAGSGNVDNITSWKDLSASSRMKNVDGLHYYEFKTDNGSNAFLLVVDLISKNWQLKPVVNQSTATTTATTCRVDAVASVNGAFFNLTNGESTSYVTVSGQLLCDPHKNKALTENVKLKPFLETIYKRSELRILKDKIGRLHFSIAPHFAPTAHDLTIVHAIQAGPRLLPTLTDKEEAFVRTEAGGTIVDSIGVNRPAARTAIGITKDGGHALLLCVASKRQDEFSSGLTLAELAELFKRLGCTEALNLDGGTSTTMSVKLSDDTVHMVCGREPETLVKSTLSVFKN
ncbi:MAG: phosphodiester glycosidase family protein [Cyanobacteria bacterium SZAS-4]|nr:phosphodiester glycosidase family protein [Cyanobacteria bacterium SZAS-4]